MSRKLSYPAFAFAVAAALLAGCRDSGMPGSDLPDAPRAIDAAPAGPDAGPQDDGTPQRIACTGGLGHGLTAVHGRLDGYLVSIVPVGAHGCNGDSTHVHLQVSAQGGTYDVAVNVSDPADVDFLAKDMALPDGPWSEGWHPGQAALLDYPSLGVHDADFTPTPLAQLTAKLDSELATANHVSIFMTGYGADGGHLVHRNGGGNDGAIVVRPLGAPRVLMFRFSDQAF
jgi:hypothetical protein